MFETAILKVMYSKGNISLASSAYIHYNKTGQNIIGSFPKFWFPMTWTQDNILCLYSW